MEFPILSIIDDKTLKNTGTDARPFWAKIGITRRIRFFGLLIFKHTSTGDFPEAIDKK
jgi:hypothetical protein